MWFSVAAGALTSALDLREWEVVTEILFNILPSFTIVILCCDSAVLILFVRISLVTGAVDCLGGRMMSQMEDSLAALCLPRAQPTLCSEMRSINTVDNSLDHIIMIRD